MFSVYKKEILGYCIAPIGYILIATMHVVSAIYLIYGTLYNNTTDISSVFSNMFSILFFFIPILTMKIFSDERRNKTDQALLTSPTSLISLLMGKFLAALTIYFLSTFQTILYGIVIDIHSTANWPTIIGQYIGILLIGASLISIGLFVSSLTESQIISAIGTFALCFLFMSFDMLKDIVKVPFISLVFRKISLQSHYVDFINGKILLSNIVFFASICAIFLFLTTKVFDSRRWK